MKREFNEIRHALEEHLESINQNTSEIQALFDYLYELDVKIDKVTQRLDHLQLQEQPQEDVTPLNQIEKQVFLLLYTTKAPLCWEEIVSKTDLPLALIQECLTTLSQKGIPLKRSYLKDQLFFELENDFKERQAKENLVNLSLQSFMETS